MISWTRWSRWRPTGASLRLCLVLLALDLGFIVLHGTHVRYDVPGSGLWLLSRDQGFPELFQYLKEGAVIWLLVDLVRRHGGALYAAWAAVFAYLLIDDSLRVHERAGEALGSALNLGSRFGIDQRDLGQIIVSALAATVLLGLIWLAFGRDRSSARLLTAQLLVLSAALGFFGVVADSIDAIDLFGVVEDGGEMATVSLMVVAVVDHRRRVSSLDERDEEKYPTAGTPVE